MSLRKTKPYLSVADYLAGECESDVRHEYVDGQVYAMAGASDRHNRIAGNFYVRLSLHLDGTPCEPFMSDMKIKVDPVLYYYPDVVVTCDGQGGDRYTRSEPRLIVEVLSASTERVDRTEKLHAYKSVESLQEYVLVSQDALHIEFHRRAEGGEWTREVLSEPDDRLALASVNLTLELRDVYRNVRFDEAPED
ncbi:MAG: Uma2 family endonuclease [Acidobacteriota bacterium]|nr:Uma2 family endonuclease [Acidobacteriota bacterium]